MTVVLSTDRRRLSQGWVHVPFAIGMTVQQAFGTLRSAGLTEVLEIVRLTEESCWVDGPRRRVSNTDPRPGLVVPPDATVKVYVNPGPTSPLSVHERSVIERVRASSRDEFEAQERIFRERRSPTPNLAARSGVTPGVTADAELLDRFEDRLRGAGALVADALAPGLTDEQIDELLLPAGIDLPEEARVWWRWHDGTRPDAPAIARTFGGREPCSLDSTVELYELERSSVVELYGLDGLLVPVDERPHIYFDCAGSRDEPVAIFWQNDVETPTAVLGSIGDLVIGWLELLDCGAWAVQRDGTFVVQQDRVPAHLTQIA
jgi:hypothetical protein